MAKGYKQSARDAHKMADDAKDSAARRSRDVAQIKERQRKRESKKRITPEDRLPFERPGESLYEKESREAEKELAKQRADRKLSSVKPTSERPKSRP